MPKWNFLTPSSETFTFKNDYQMLLDRSDRFSEQSVQKSVLYWTPLIASWVSTGIIASPDALLFSYGFWLQWLTDCTCSTSFLVPFLISPHHSSWTATPPLLINLSFFPLYTVLEVKNFFHIPHQLMVWLVKHTKDWWPSPPLQTSLVCHGKKSPFT